MDFFHTQNQQQKHNQPKSSNNNNNKKRLSEDQVSVLERTFITNKKLEPKLKLQLANQLGVPPRQVAIWYQNKRARWKTQSLELDYNTLQFKLENALVDRRRLEKQVMQLKDDLRKAHDQLGSGNFNQLLINNNPPNNNSTNYGYHQLHPPNTTTALNGSCNSSCDEGGSSASFHEDVNNDEVLKLDELFACLVASNNGAGATWGSSF